MASLGVVEVTPETLDRAGVLDAVVVLDAAWRDSDATREVSRAWQLHPSRPTEVASEASTVHFVAEGTLAGYASYLCAGGTDVHVTWLVAPKVGEAALRALVRHLRERRPFARTLSLCVAMDASDDPRAAPARLNLYVRRGGFAVKTSMGMPDGSTTLWLTRPLEEPFPCS